MKGDWEYERYKGRLYGRPKTGYVYYSSLNNEIFDCAYTHTELKKRYQNADFFRKFHVRRLTYLGEL